MPDQDIRLSSGHRIWARVLGEGPGLPLLVLHGGPGSAHDYLEGLAALGRERPVVFYDQLGCGRSDQPEDPALYTIARAAQDLAELRAALGLGRCHVLGQSAGGMLALEHLARGGSAESLVLASTPVSMRAFQADMDDLIAGMEPAVRDVLVAHRVAGRFDTAEFDAAITAFYGKHLCRMAVWPDCALRSGQYQMASATYRLMLGPADYAVTGNLVGWDRSADLPGLRMPVLALWGRWDYIQPRGVALLKAGLPGAELVEFPESSHLAHLEEPEAFLAQVAAFLARVEVTRGTS